MEIAENKIILVTLMDKTKNPTGNFLENVSECDNSGAPMLLYQPREPELIRNTKTISTSCNIIIKVMMLALSTHIRFAFCCKECYTFEGSV